MEKSTVTPATCPRCGSLKRSKKTGSRVTEFGSTQHVNGVECTAIRYSYVTCENCGQRYIIREPVLTKKSSPGEQKTKKKD
jgi:transcription elongation factor Elf1